MNLVFTPNLTELSRNVGYRLEFLFRHFFCSSFLKGFFVCIHWVIQKKRKFYSDGTAAQISTHNTTDMLVTTIDRIFYKSSLLLFCSTERFCQWRSHAQWMVGWLLVRLVLVVDGSALHCFSHRPTLRNMPSLFCCRWHRSHGRYASMTFLRMYWCVWVRCWCFSVVYACIDVWLMCMCASYVLVRKHHLLAGDIMKRIGFTVSCEFIHF